jgi:hypothetical protein
VSDETPTLLELRRWHQESQGTLHLAAAERGIAAMAPETLAALAAKYPVAGATDEERQLALTFAVAALGGDRLDKMGLIMANLRPHHLAARPERVEHVDVVPLEKP